MRLKVLLTGAFASVIFMSVGSAAFAESKTFEQPAVQSTSLISALADLPNITVTGETVCKNPFAGTANAVSTSDATDIEDTIYAKVRVYDSDGGLLNSAEDTGTNSSHASARANNTTIFLNGDYAYGNHKFVKSGYDTISFETTAEW